MKKIFLIALLFSSFVHAEYSEEFRVKKSLEYFDQAAKVFLHPRCLNCHPAGDRPTVGMDMHVHPMNVKRGDGNFGMPAMQCNTCHQEHNNVDSKVPGAPKWALAPKEIAWQGLSKKQLCERLKDKKRTRMTMEEFLDHSAHDELVAWGWNPGAGRAPAPYTQKQFGEFVAGWIETGAECPKN